MDVLVLKRLYPRVYEAAFLNHCEQGGFDINCSSRALFDELCTDSTFYWSKTLEGYHFWHLIYIGAFSEAGELIPVYFMVNVHESSLTKGF